MNRALEVSVSTRSARGAGQDRGRMQRSSAGRGRWGSSDRAAPTSHGKRGPVLSRKMRRELQRSRDEALVRAERQADAEATMLASSLADIHNETRPTSLFRWPLELNMTARIVNVSLYLFAPWDAPSRLPVGVRHVDRAHWLESSHVNQTVNVGGDGPSTSTPAWMSSTAVASDVDGVAGPIAHPFRANAAGTDTTHVEEPHDSASPFIRSVVQTDRPDVDTEQTPRSSLDIAHFVDRVIGAWIRKRCGVVMRLAYQASGLRWQPEQDTLTRLANAPCKLTFDARGHKVSHARPNAANETRLEIEWVNLGRLMLPASEAQHVFNDTRSDRIAREASSVASDWSVVSAADSNHEAYRWPDIDAALRCRVYPCRLIKPHQLGDVFRKLAMKVAEFLQGPCGALVKDYHERMRLNSTSRLTVVATTACDMIYTSNPVGIGLSVFGYLSEMTLKLLDGTPMTTEEMTRGINLLSFRPTQAGQVDVGKKKMLWTGTGLNKIHEDASGARLVHERPKSTPDSIASVPDLPIEHSAQGWTILEIPREYRASGVDASLVDNPQRAHWTGDRTGYVKMDDAIYEVRKDVGSTRWNIVPPDGKVGANVPIEFTDARGWERIRPIGAGDRPPLATRYATRDAQMLSGPEQDVYLEAHAELYDASLLPANADQTALNVLTERFADDDSLTVRERGVLHGYIETRRWKHLHEALGHKLRGVFNSPISGIASEFHDGLRRGDVYRVPGYRRSMGVDALVGLAISGELTSFEIGACFRQINRRMNRAEMHRAADNILRSGQRATSGALRSEHIAIPGVAADASFDAMLKHFIDGRLTDTQRGALGKRVAQAGERVRERTSGALRHLEHVRESAVPAQVTAVRYGYERYRDIAIDGVGPQTPLESLLDTALGYADDARMTGALGHWVEDRSRDIDAQLDAFRATWDQLYLGHETFVSGMNEAAYVDLPDVPLVTTHDAFNLFFDDALTLKQRGAVYARFREFDALDRIQDVIADRAAQGEWAEIRAGGADPASVHVDRLHAGVTLEELAERVERESLSARQLGRIDRFAKGLAERARSARSEFALQRILTGPQFDAYLDGYFEARQGLAPAFANEPLDRLAQMYRSDGEGARVRGQMAYYIAQSDLLEGATELATLHYAFGGVSRENRIVFTQSELPRLLTGIQEQGAFPLIATMSVALQEGDAAVTAFIARARRLQPENVGDRLRANDDVAIERREFYGAFGALAAHAPSAEAELMAGEVTLIEMGIEWPDIREVVAGGIEDLNVAIDGPRLEAARTAINPHGRLTAQQEVDAVRAFNRDESTSYMIETDRHAMLIRLEYSPRAERRIALRLYEPSYGILRFETLASMWDVLRRAFESGYFRHRVLGGSRRLRLYALDPERLAALRIRGDLYVRDLVNEAPFVQPVSGAHEIDAGPAEPGVRGGLIGETDGQAARSPDEARRGDLPDLL